MEELQTEKKTEVELSCNGLGVEEALGRPISQLKKNGDYKGLMVFLQEQLEKILSAAGETDLLSKLNNELGLAHLELEELEEAATYMDRAVELDPENINAAYNRANLSLYHKDLEDALHRYGLILADRENHVGATYNSALCHALSGRVPEALPLFKQVVTLEPEYAGAHFWAGECLLDQGKSGEALAYFKGAAELNPGHPESIRGLAICLFHSGAYEKAIDNCDKLLTQSGPELMALRVKGDCLLAMNNPKEAAECHIHMAQIDFDAREFVSNRAKFLAQAEPEKAPAYIDAVLKHIPEFKPTLGNLMGAPTAPTS